MTHNNKFNLFKKKKNEILKIFKFQNLFLKKSKTKTKTKTKVKFFKKKEYSPIEHVSVYLSKYLFTSIYQYFFKIEDIYFKIQVINSLKKKVIRIFKPS